MSLNTAGSLYLDLARKALNSEREVMASITQEVKKALGLDEPRQQHRGRG